MKIPPRPPFVEREDERGLNATVLHSQSGKQQCADCGGRAILYNAHFPREHMIFTGCMGCITRRAGGLKAVHLKSEVKRQWERNDRMVVDTSAATAAKRKG